MKSVREVVSRDVIEDLWGAGYTILPQSEPVYRLRTYADVWVFFKGLSRIYPLHSLDGITDALRDEGYAIVPRIRHYDQFYVPENVVPQGRSYQWMHLIHDKALFESFVGAKPNAWAPVPASRHDGYFMPAGHIGDIEVNGLGLFEKPKFEVEADRASQVAAAHKQVDDWKAKWGGQFSGEVSVGSKSEIVGDRDTAKMIHDRETKQDAFSKAWDRMYSKDTDDDKES